MSSGLGASAPLRPGAGGEGARASAPVAQGRQVQRQTFYLIGCEACERFASPPATVPVPDFAAPSTVPLRCNECGELLLLAECFVADQTEMWQHRPGAAWHHVVYADRLPDKKGRSLWTA